ncbi:hypothetical protein G210_3565 [Candida maltosa Xu316]|uniref:Uncharacterized protein n=1 Tax=Candida maltosa (strain Xu316) TaxID=1245528 RepID=M3IV44_CANMX|nr:hypothetical protein G210_3565 [Candida maltosa Xu316]
MCMLQPKQQVTETTEQINVPIDSEKQQITESTEELYISTDLEKQQQPGNHEAKRNLCKLLILLNVFSLLILGMLYYFVGLNPGIFSSLNELLYKMEKCNDL